MRVLDLFAGIGGFSLAAHWMGWQTVAFVEWDKYCQKVLKKNFPGVPIYGDIREFNEQITTNTNTGFELEQEGQIQARRDTTNNGSKEYKRIFGIDIITGGFPCQPFSHAGKRKGTDDNRYLWPEMLRTIQTIKPLWVVGENVAGLISMENGKTLERILIDLEDSGYHTETFLIPACSIGAWHRRDRVWIVSHTGHAESQGREQPERINKRRIKEGEQSRGEFTSRNRKHGLRKVVSNSANTGIKGMHKWRNLANREQWNIEPNVGRVANGIPSRVDRLKALGNAIVPQAAYEIFKAIDHENDSKTTY